MQVLSKPDIAGPLDRSMADVVPGGRGLAAWQALLRSRATLMRRLERDLEKETGLALADFDVLAQVALAGGLEAAKEELRETWDARLLSVMAGEMFRGLRCASKTS
jgi:hypothetical protein